MVLTSLEWLLRTQQDLGIRSAIDFWPRPVNSNSVLWLILLLCVSVRFVNLCRLIGETAGEPLADLSEVQLLESTHPSMPLGCRLRRAFLTVASRVLLLTTSGLSNSNRYLCFFLSFVNMEHKKHSTFQLMFLLCLFAVLGCIIGTVWLVRYRWRRQQVETQQMYDMVARIVGTNS